MKKISLLLMASVLTTAILLTLAFHSAAFAASQGASAAQPALTSPALTVYCWIPHAIEITDADGTWCITGVTGSVQVNIYGVIELYNTTNNTPNSCVETVHTADHALVLLQPGEPFYAINDPFYPDHAPSQMHMIQVDFQCDSSDPNP